MPTFDAATFIHTINKIVKADPIEADFRTAINRVYYACHLIGRSALTQKGWYQPKYTGEDHRGIITKLQEHTPWGSKLLTLLRLREHVDYCTDSADRRTSPCSYCQEASSKAVLLVDNNMWEQAKAIQEDILPRLKALFPTKG